MDEDEEATPVTHIDVISVEIALTHACRLLHMAELETNLAVMERFEKLADSWMGMAALLMRD